MDKDLTEVIRKGAGAFIVRIAGALATFIINIILANSLGTDGFGLFSLALTSITILAVFSRLGLDTIVLRDVSKKNKAALSGYAREVVTPVLKLILPVAVSLICLLLLISPWISVNIYSKTNLTGVLMGLSPLLLLLSVGYILGEGFKSIGRTEIGMFIQNTALPILFICLFLMLSWIIKIGSASAAWLYSGSGVTVLIASTILWFFQTSKPKTKNTIKKIKLIKKGFPMLLVSSGGLLLAWTDVIVLGIYETETNVGIYTAASRVALLTSLLLVSANAILGPKFSNLYAKGDMIGIKRLAKQSTRLMIFLVLLPTLIILIFPKDILGLFGDGFSDGSDVLVILTISQFINVICGPVGYMLVMTGHEHLTRNIMLGTALVNIALSVLLVKLFGMMGVTVATAVSVLIWNVLSLLSVRRVIGFWML